MEEIVWIRPADYDPAVIAGLVFQPEPHLPAFEVLDRRRVVMMFNAGPAWEIRPFTQLTLRIVENADRSDG
ncbi:hypothetical protein [Methylobacterium sp. 77]|uniref:hypothetical protein n=1 Tax=Methylobacterium sp. 77 TaxID=1101192 RepID=UPI00035C750C|nr:hypothetical protein [Methylobacterium sp. 77]